MFKELSLISIGWKQHTELYLHIAIQILPKTYVSWKDQKELHHTLSTGCGHFWAVVLQALLCSLFFYVYIKVTSCLTLPGTALVLAPKALLWTVGRSSVHGCILRWVCAIWQEGPKIKWQVTSWWGLCRSQAVDFLVIKFIWLILENLGKSRCAKT